MMDKLIVTSAFIGITMVIVTRSTPLGSPMRHRVAMSQPERTFQERDEYQEYPIPHRDNEYPEVQTPTSGYIYVNPTIRNGGWEEIKRNITEMRGVYKKGWKLREGYHPYMFLAGAKAIGWVAIAWTLVIKAAIRM